MAKKVKASDMPDSPFIHDSAILGQLIKAKRTALRLKMADCAALCGVGINTLSRIENGNGNCTMTAVFAVLHGLGIKLTCNELASAVSSDAANQGWV